MNDSQRENRPCGVRLMHLMDTRLAGIIRREHRNRNRIYLYGSGEYWVAFEQSAYLLGRIFSENETAVVSHPAYPFPVVMAAVPDRTLKTYSRSHLFRRDEPDYRELVAEEITPEQYRIWHGREVKEALR